MRERNKKMHELAVQPSTESCGYTCSTRSPEDPCQKQAMTICQQVLLSKSKEVDLQDDMRSYTTHGAIWQRKEEKHVDTRQYDRPY